MTMSMTETTLGPEKDRGLHVTIRQRRDRVTALEPAGRDTCDTPEGSLCARSADFDDLFIGCDPCSDCGGTGASIDGICDRCWADRHLIDDEWDDGSW